MITNPEYRTTIDEIADSIFRISVPFPEANFSFNQYLVVDEEPLLFHTGLRMTFPLVSEAINSVIPVQSLRYLAFSHFESDECGALNQFLAVAPQAVPVCSRVAAMTSVTDFADRPPRALTDREALVLGKKTVQWFDTPHLPHGWEAGYLFEKSTETLFCGDLFTQGGAVSPAVTASNLLEPSEAFRIGFSAQTGLPDAYGMTKDARPHLEKLAALNPRVLAAMHGSAWSGTGADGAEMLRALADRVSI